LTARGRGLQGRIHVSGRNGSQSAARRPRAKPFGGTICVRADGKRCDDARTFALVRETEGLTAITMSSTGGWARISLGVHSSLEAVGLTAVLSRTLADAGISANIVAALHHDHIFVPWDRREEALTALVALTES
jgi:uncharacterized protein